MGGVMLAVFLAAVWLGCALLGTLLALALALCGYPLIALLAVAAGFVGGSYLTFNLSH